MFEDEAKQLLAGAGIPVNRCIASSNPEQAVQLAGEFGYPVALKVRSGLISHKTDIGGVLLDLNGPDDVHRAYREIISRAEAIDPKARVTVQPMAEQGVEVIVGVTTDSQFGKVIMFGLGGVFTEVLKDVSFRLCPVDKDEALKMIRNIRGVKMLEGFRGAPPADMESLSQLLAGISLLVETRPEILEMDLNPVRVYPGRALVLDARVRLGV